MSMNKKLSQTGAGTTEWIVFPKGAKDIGVDIGVTGTVDVDVEVTNSPDLQTKDSSIAAGDINDVSGMTGLTAKGSYRVDGPIRGIRFTQNSGVGTTTMTVTKVD